MAVAIGKKLLDSQIKSQVNLERFSEHVRGKVIGLLNEAQDSIVADIVRIDPTAPTATKYRRLRMARLNKSIRGILDQQYGKVKDLVDTELKDVVKFTGKETVEGINKIIGAELFDVTLTERGLESIVNNTMIDGEIIGKWWDAQREDVRKRMGRQMLDATQQVQLGLVRGEAVDELVRRIRGTKLTPGIMSISKKNATALVRTSVMQVANEARMAMYEGNKDLINGYEIVATLDKRTCPQCRAYDGKQWVEEEE